MKVKKSHILIWLVLIVLAFFIALAIWRHFKPGITEELNLTVIEKPKPNLTSDTSAFVDAGCAKEGDYLNCSSINLKGRYSCDEIISPSDSLGGLSPKVPMVECTFWKENWSSDEGIIHTGCLAPSFNKYIALTNDGFKLIRNKEEFRQFFAPVETPEEALGFAYALTNSYPMYDITVPKNYKVFVSKIKATYAEETFDGFKVHLFDYDFCGCGPHSHYAVDYLVTKAGEVKEISRQKIFENPEEEGLCVD